uniref:Uncharacterized protein n=2 Tax=Arion vulgaris TaxID=1028688 RepID=A0A0B7ARS1_9EUPU
MSPLILLTFFGVASSLLMALLVLALCSRQNQFRSGGRLQFKLSPEYYRLDSDVTV